MPVKSEPHDGAPVGVSPGMLTGREVEVLQALADGLSTTDAALKLFISTETMKSHVRHALMKTGATNRTHAIALGFRAGILT